MTTIHVTNLKFQYAGIDFDPHEEEFDPSNIWHPCMKWAFDQGMQVDFKATETGSARFAVGDECIGGEIDFDVEATFENDADAVMFRLVWGDKL